MGKVFDILSIGGAVSDITFYTDQAKVISTPEDLTAQRLLGFELGAKINPKEIHYTFGGGAANSSVALSRLGYKVGICARLGEDQDGKRLQAWLKKEKVDAGLIQLDRRERTGFSFILAYDKRDREHVSFVNRGANNNLAFRQQDCRRTCSRWIYLTSLSGNGWLGNLKSIFNFNQDQAGKIYWNPGNLQLQAGKKVLAPYLARTQVLLLNKDEAIELVLSGIKLGRKNPNHLNRPLYLLNILHDWGPKIVVITDGAKGGWAYDGKKIYQQKIFKSKVINTNGVGDAFGSAFLAGLIYEKCNIGRALKWGMANSSSVVTKVGAQTGLLTKAEVLKKIGKK